LTPIIAAFVALGFFGLDELGEILDSPFGCDPNSVNFERHAIYLAEDLDCMWEHMMSGSIENIIEAQEEESEGLAQRIYHMDAEPVRSHSRLQH
jgi:predicted membrane chloride channel (bestrophin family)